MKQFYTIVALLFMGLFLGSCEKKDVLNEPPALMLFPIYNDARISSTELNQAKMHYEQNGLRVVRDLKFAPNANRQKGALISSDVATLSAVEGIKEFVLKIPGYEDVKLEIDYERLTTKEAKEDACYCNKPQRSVKYKGENLNVESKTSKGENVYYVYMSK